MKPTVIYHSADYDGIFCREIARKFVPNANLIGWNFGDSLVPVPECLTYILDLSPDCLAGPSCNLIWIDHHKTSIEKYSKNDIPGYRIDGVAACRLAWQWFNAKSPHQDRLAAKENFIDRQVSEPLAVRLAGEYDVWDKRDPRAETFQYALRVLNEDSIPGLIGANGDYWTEKFLPQGTIAQVYAQKMDADLVKHRSYRLKWEGLDFIVLNTGRFNSLTFAALDVPETGHDALMGYMFNGDVWTVSLYHAKHRTDLDLSEIAKRYGGGGHRGACGFTCKILPFMPA